MNQRGQTPKSQAVWIVKKTSIFGFGGGTIAENVAEYSALNAVAFAKSRTSSDLYAISALASTINTPRALLECLCNALISRNSQNSRTMSSNLEKLGAKTRLKEPYLKTS